MTIPTEDADRMWMDLPTMTIRTNSLQEVMHLSIMCDNGTHSHPTMLVETRVWRGYAWHD